MGKLWQAVHQNFPCGPTTVRTDYSKPQVLGAAVSKKLGLGAVFLFLPASASFTDGVSGWARGGEKCPYRVKEMKA